MAGERINEKENEKEKVRKSIEVEAYLEKGFLDEAAEIAANLAKEDPKLAIKVMEKCVNAGDTCSVAKIVIALAKLN